MYFLPSDDGEDLPLGQRHRRHPCLTLLVVNEEGRRSWQGVLFKKQMQRLLSKLIVKIILNSSSILDYTFDVIRLIMEDVTVAIKLAAPIPLTWAHDIWLDVQSSGYWQSFTFLYQSKDSAISPTCLPQFLAGVGWSRHSSPIGFVLAVLKDWLPTDRPSGHRQLTR